MKSILILNLFLCILCSAQNDAYYISKDMSIKRVDLDSNTVKEYYSFLDTIVVKRIVEDFAVAPFSRILFQIDSSKKTIPISPLRPPIFEGPYYGALIDSVNVDEKWYKIEIVQTDDHFVGGSPNRVTTDIMVQDLGVIYTYSNWMDAHTDIMICHRNETKQKIITGVFEWIQTNYPDVIEASHLARIIDLTKEYNFNNLIEILSEKWLAPRKDLKLIASNSTIINGQINFSVTIKNVSEKGYFFHDQSEFGPAMIEYLQNDVWVTQRIEGASHGTRYHYNFQKIYEPIYLNPGQEITFDLKPNMRENCGTCSQNKFFGIQVDRYGVYFYPWIFSKEKEHDGKNYTLYHLKEIK